MTGTVRIVAIALMVVGAATSLTAIGAVTTMDADRPTTVAVASDQTNALLGVESNGDIGEIRADSGAIQAGTLYNNTGEDLTVLNTTLVNDDGVLDVDTPLVGDTFGGPSQAVSVQCAESTSVGQREVQLLAEVEGSTIGVQQASFNFTVDIQCNKGSGSGSVNFQANDVSTSDTSQTFSFSVDGLKNKDTAIIDLSNPQGSGVDYSGGTVSVVSGPTGTVSYDEAQDRITYEASSNPSGTVEIRISGISVTGTSGDYYTVSYTENRKRDTDRDDSDVFFITD